MKRVLIITYYWPPAGGVPVQRWVKMCKYLHNAGWEPVIYTAESSDAQVQDNSLLDTLPGGIEVIRRPIWEPYGWYRRLLGMPKNGKINAAFLEEKKSSGVLQKIAIWIRGNFFIPDARVFWIKPSRTFLLQYLQNNPVDLIISTGPPHSMHLIAAGLKEKTNIPWIADFRDPWTKIDYYQDLNLSRRADRKHHRLEKKVLCTADKVVTVSPHWAEDFNAVNNGNTVVITNGYDPDDFPLKESQTSRHFTLHHVGMINKARNPENLWSAIAEIIREEKGFAGDLKICFTGTMDYSVRESLKKYVLMDYLVDFGQLPHREAIRNMQQAALLLLLVNDAQDILGRIPAKLFEYLAAGRPVLNIGDPAGDAAQIIAETGAGLTVSLNDAEAIKEALRTLYHRWKAGDRNLPPLPIEKYTREAIAMQYAALMHSLTKP